MFLKQKYIRHTVSSGSVTDDYVGVKQIDTTVLLGCSTNHLFPILLPLKQAETHTQLYALLDFLQEIQVHFTIFLHINPYQGRYSRKEMKKPRFAHCCQGKLRDQRAIIMPYLCPSIFCFDLIPTPPPNHPQVIKPRENFFWGITYPRVKKKRG